MSCERNSGKAGACALASGISGLASKSAHLAGKAAQLARQAGPPVVGKAVQLAGKAAPVARRVAPHVAVVGGAGLAAYAGYKLVGWAINEANASYERTQQERREKRAKRIEQELLIVRDPERQQAKVSLQRDFIGAGSERFHEVFGDDHTHQRLSGNTWMAEGSRGKIAYESIDGMYVIQAIRPALGKEQVLQRKLAAYSVKNPVINAPSPPTVSEDRQTKSVLAENLAFIRQTKDRLTGKENGPEDEKITARQLLASNLDQVKETASVGARWYKDHRDQINAVDTTVASAVGVLTNPGTGAEKALQLAYLAGRANTQLSAIQALKQAGARLAEALKDPELKKAAVDIQRNLVGAEFSDAQVSSLFMDWDRTQLQENTWTFKGELGKLYFEDQGNGNVRLLDASPEIGCEVDLRNGLKSLQRQPVRA